MLSELEKGILGVACAKDDGIIAPDDVAIVDLAGDLFLARDTCKSLRKRKLLDQLGSSGNYKINAAGRATQGPGGSY